MPRRFAADAVISSEEVPADWYAIVRLKRGEALRIVDPTGQSSVSMIAWRAEDTSERINCADTVKVQWSAAISKGRVILTDMGRVLFSLTEDTCGAHDLLVGGSTPASAFAAYGAVSRNTQENFIGGRGQGRARSARHSALCQLLCAGLGRFDRPLRLEGRGETAGGFRRPAGGNECYSGAVELRASAQPRASVPLASDHAGALSRAGSQGRRCLPDTARRKPCGRLCSRIGLRPDRRNE